MMYIGDFYRLLQGGTIVVGQERKGSVLTLPCSSNVFYGPTHV